MIWFVLALAALLRLTSLSTVPPGLYLDEILYGLDAYSLIHTGKDIYGRILPLAFQSSGYYPPLFTYLLAPLFLFLPLTDWVVRLPAAISGVLTVWFTYLLTKKLLKLRALALISTLILAVSVWHIHISRAAFLGSFGLSFPVAATYFWLRGNFLTSIILFALSTHAHYGYKLFSPAIFILLLIFYRPNFKRFSVFPAVLIISLTLFSHWLAITRFNALFRIREVANFSPLSIINQYLAAYTPSFLFLTGDHNRLLNPSPAGQLPVSLLPFFLTGFLSWWRLTARPKWLLLVWLLLSPLPSALAGLGAHAVRNSPMLIPMTVISSLGVWQLFKLPLNRIGQIARLTLLGLFFLETLWQFSFYWRTYSQISAPLWGQNQRQFVNQLLTRQDDFVIIIPDKFYVNLSYYAFQSQLQPQLLQQTIITRRLGNLYFADE